MRFTDITTNGAAPITTNGKATLTPEVTVYVPADIGTATIALSFIDKDDNVVPYTDGAILAGEQKRVRCGVGVKLVANIANYSTPFSLGYAY